MPTLKPNLSYEVVNTYVTDSGENRLNVLLKIEDTVEVEGEQANVQSTIAQFDFGYGGTDPSTANVVHLIYTAVPQLFTE